MFTDLNVFKLSYAMARHAGQRQTVIARNIANADTPGFRARDVTPFADTLRRGGAAGMRTTRARHLSSAAGDGGARVFEAETPMDPNRNSVSLELEMVNGLQAKQQHNRALAIYRSSMQILRTSLGRG